MSFYNDLHNLYRGVGQPIVGAVENETEPQVEEEEDFEDDFEDFEETPDQKALARAEENRKKYEEENTRRNMADLERRTRYNKGVEAAQNAAIAAAAFWLFEKG